MSHDPLQQPLARLEQQLRTLEHTLADLPAAQRPALAAQAEALRGTLALLRQAAEQSALQSQALHESEDSYRRTMAAALAGIYVIRDLTFVYVNPTLARLFGYSPQELENRRGPLDLAVPEQRDTLRAYLTQWLSSVPGSPREIRFLRKDGTVFDAMIWGKGMMYRGHPAATGTLVDISERKRMETRLRESEVELRLITAQMPSILWTTDNELCIRHIIGAGLTLIGRNPEVYLGRHLHDLFNRDTHAIVIRTHRRALAGKRGSYEFMLEGKRFKVQVEPLRTDNGQISGCIGLAVDITEQEESQEKLRLLQTGLLRMARHSTLGGTISGLAHEINQPLTAIQGYTQACLALLTQGNPNPERLTQAMQQVAEQGRRAGQIIQRLRRFVRQSAQATPAVDVAGLIQDVVDLAQWEAYRHSIQIEMQLPDDLPHLLVDALQIQQVVLHLLQNAVEALHGAEGTRTVTVSARRLHPQGVEVAVSDTGPGIPAAVLPKLFTPFFTTKTQGMGIGLWISHVIVEETYGGRLWTTANPDGGVTFHFTLPLREIAA